MRDRGASTGSSFDDARTSGPEVREIATPYDAENTAERERMRALVRSLDDQQLQRAANAEWSVTDVLAHLAFWDARVVYFVERWLDGRLSPSSNDEEPE